MNDRDRYPHPIMDPKNRPSPWFLMALAVGIAVVVTLFGRMDR